MGAIELARGLPHVIEHPAKLGQGNSRKRFGEREIKIVDSATVRVKIDIATEPSAVVFVILGGPKKLLEI